MPCWWVLGGRVVGRAYCYYMCALIVSACGLTRVSQSKMGGAVAKIKISRPEDQISLTVVQSFKPRLKKNNYFVTQRGRKSREDSAESLLSVSAASISAVQLRVEV